MVLLVRVDTLRLTEALFPTHLLTLGHTSHVLYESFLLVVLLQRMSTIWCLASVPLLWTAETRRIYHALKLLLTKKECNMCLHVAFLFLLIVIKCHGLVHASSALYRLNRACLLQLTLVHGAKVEIRFWAQGQPQPDKRIFKHVITRFFFIDNAFTLSRAPEHTSITTIALVSMNVVFLHLTLNETDALTVWRSPRKWRYWNQLSGCESFHTTGSSNCMVLLLGKCAKVGNRTMQQNAMTLKRKDTT